jgi:hypothetical protein
MQKLVALYGTNTAAHKLKYMGKIVDLNTAALFAA